MKFVDFHFYHQGLDFLLLLTGHFQNSHLSSNYMRSSRHFYLYICIDANVLVMNQAVYYQHYFWSYLQH